MIYISEAHPTDGRQVPANRRAGVLIAQPKTIEERFIAAKQVQTVVGLKLPVAVDGMDDKIARDYAAWPDRIYIIGTDGKVRYKGKPGPGGFNSSEAEQALAGF